MIGNRSRVWSGGERVEWRFRIRWACWRERRRRQAPAVRGRRAQPHQERAVCGELPIRHARSVRLDVRPSHLAGRTASAERSKPLR